MINETSLIAKHACTINQWRAWCALSCDWHLRNSASLTFFTQSTATPDSRAVPSFRSLLVAIDIVQDEGSAFPTSTIARREQSSHCCPIDCSDPFTMRTVDHCGVAHTIHQWHKDRHMDSQPVKASAKKMAICCCTSVSVHERFSRTGLHHKRRTRK